MPYVNGQWVDRKPVGKVTNSKKKEEHNMTTNDTQDTQDYEAPREDETKPRVTRNLGTQEHNVQNIIEIASRVQKAFGPTGNFDAVFAEIMRVCYPY